MRFVEIERQRLISMREAFFEDPGSGIFAGIPREFVLKDPTKNLWSGIRADALAYFAKNEISWWRGSDYLPTGHLLSSQVACINHLYTTRQRPDLASCILRAVDPEITRAVPVDQGFVEFEFIGKHQYLEERSFTRGANCTSIDAFMIGETTTGARRAFLIEWKYTESYSRKDLYIPERAIIYDTLISHGSSPFRNISPRELYYEPFYQLMRQTLLGWQISEHAHYGCTSYRHIHVVPEHNTEFHMNITAPTLIGKTVSEAWSKLLKYPENYLITTPRMFMHPIMYEQDTRSISDYLHNRYW